MPRAQIIQILSGVLSGLMCINENKLTYKNLTPEHILINKNGDVITLCGLEATGPSKDYKYMSPKILKNKKDDQADIWSLGCILHELCCLEVSFRTNNSLHLIRAPKNFKSNTYPQQIIILMQSTKNMEIV